MASVKVLGTEYPMAYTVGAQNELAAHFGSLEAIAALAESDAASNADASVRMVAAFMSAAARRGRVRAKVLGETYDGPEPLSYDELTAVLSNEDLLQMSQAIREAIEEGNHRTVEVVEKNAEATPSK